MENNNFTPAYNRMRTLLHSTGVYKSDFSGKRDFVEERLAPLLKAAGTGWNWGATYRLIAGDDREEVCLLCEDGSVGKVINVRGDSCKAIVYDVFKNL